MFQKSSAATGHEIKWAGAASEIAGEVEWLTNGLAKFLGHSNVELSIFAEEGNAKISNDVFNKLQTLYNGEAKKGDEAKWWDAMALSQEQHLIQNLYEGLSDKSVVLLSTLVKQRLVGTSIASSVPPLPKNCNVLDVSQR